MFYPHNFNDDYWTDCRMQAAADAANAKHNYYGHEVWFEVPTQPIIKPSRSKVQIEDLGCDLLSGVKLAPLVRKVSKEHKCPSHPQVFYVHLKDDHWMDEAHTTFILPVESYLKDESAKSEAAKVWYPFMVSQIDSVTLLEAMFPKHNGKSKKVIQRFAVRLSDIPADTPHVPCIQFYCGPKSVRHTGVQFKHGDLITVVIRHDKYPLMWPKPPFVVVTPTELQHIVPMQTKQRLMIVTRKENQACDYKGHAKSGLVFDETVDAEFGRQCHYFHLNKGLSASEVIFINNKKKKESRKVIIPFAEKDVRCPIIMNPLRDSVIHAQDIDGFTVRFLKDVYHPVIAAPGTPVRPVFTNENAQYVERRFEIDKKRPFFYLRRHEHSWVINEKEDSK